MNVLALYDIHGNIDALEAVLADPAAAGADVVVIGGDAVPGPFAAATLERLEPLEARWIRGNGEREVAEAVGAPDPDPADSAAVTAKLTARELGPEAARGLGELPLTLEIDGVLYCHATPRADDEMVTRISSPERWRSVLSTTDAKVVVAGHTHQQDDRDVGDVRFVNAGSMGLPYEGDGAARWMWVADGVPHLRRTTYDHLAAGERMRDRWPDDALFVQSIEAALIEPVPATAVTEIFEGLARTSGTGCDARAESRGADELRRGLEPEPSSGAIAYRVIAGSARRPTHAPPRWADASVLTRLPRPPGGC